MVLKLLCVLPDKINASKSPRPNLHHTLVQLLVHLDFIPWGEGSGENWSENTGIATGLGKLSNPKKIFAWSDLPVLLGNTNIFARFNYYHCPATKLDLSQAWLIFQNNILPTSKSFGSPRHGSTIATLVGALVTISARTSRSEKSFVFMSSIVDSTYIRGVNPVNVLNIFRFLWRGPFLGDLQKETLMLTQHTR